MKLYMPCIYFKLIFATNSAAMDINNTVGKIIDGLVQSKLYIVARCDISHLGWHTGT